MFTTPAIAQSVSLLKSVDKPEANVGDTLTFTLTPFYTGNAAVVNMRVQDVIPNGTLLVTNSAGGSFTNNELTWTVGTTVNGSPGITLSNGTSSLSAAGDTYIRQDGAANNYGTVNEMEINSESSKLRTVLLSFDLSSIPAGVTINSAWLRVVVETAGAGRTSALHRATTTWTETGATWNLRNGVNTWSGGGAFGSSDYNATVLGGFDLGTLGTKSNDVTSTVAAWVSGSASNQGFVLRGTGAIGNAKIHSREAAAATNKPTLIVNWSQPVTSNSLDISPNIVTVSGNVQVVMSIYSLTELTNVTPFISATNAVGGVDVSYISGPTPASANVHTNPVSFTFVYRVTAGSTTGTLAFSGGATATGGTFATATSDRILVSPSFTFQTVITNPPGASFVTNVGRLNNSAALPQTNSLPTTTLVYSVISGQVRNDTNANGNLSAAYPGITNVTLTLFSDPDGDGDPSDGTAIATNITDSSGHYRFSLVPTGRYVVVESDPANFRSTADSQGANDNRIAVFLPFVQHAGSNNFLNTQRASISGHVRHDDDADGDFLDADDGITGVTVILFTDPNGDGNPADGAPIATNVTDATGLFVFTNVAAGRFVLVQTDLPGYVSTADSDGPNDNWIAVHMPGAADSDDHVFLDTHTADILGFVREDADGDGDLGDTDAGLPGVSVVLYSDPDGNGDPSDGVALATNVTAANGSFLLASNMPGHYVLLQSDLPGFVSTADSDGANDNQITITVIGGQASSNHVFLDTAPAAISGQVREDADGDGDLNDGDSGIAGVTVFLFTDPNGDGDPADGVVLATNITDSSGNYVYSSVMPGRYVVIEVNPPGFNSTADAQGANDDHIAVTLTSGNNSTGNHFLDAQPAAIGGYVREDADGDGDLGDADAGLPGAEIILYSDPNGDGNPVDGVALATNITDGSGYVLFPSNMPGRYLLMEVNPSGFNSTANSQGANDDRIAFALTSGNDSTNHVFLDARPADISGQVRNDTDADGDFSDPDDGITGVTIVLWTDPNGDGDPADGLVVATNITDGSGTFNFPSNMPRAYVIVENEPPHFRSTADTFGANDNQIAVHVFSGQATNNHVFLNTQLANISGQVREDLDGDGDLGDTDPGITNVTMTLYTDPDGDGDPSDGSVVDTTTTDHAGNYLFVNVNTGRFVIVESNPSGFNSTADAQGANDDRITLFMAGATNATARDFLDARPADISGQVRNDTDGDGDFGDTDIGIAGVNVALWTDPNGDSNPSDGVGLATNVTDGSGYFLFPSNMPGTYVLVETDPPNFRSTADTYGSNDNLIALHVYSGQPTNGQVFLNTQLAEVRGQVREDVDGDGDLNDADPGITNVTITLYTDPDGNGDPGDGSVVASTVTDASGLYQFINVNTGFFVVVQTDRPGYYSTADAQGANDNRIARFMPGAVDSVSNVFLDARFATISGQVRLDTDGDGDLNDEDAGITNVAVILYTDPNGDGDPVDGFAVATNYTDAGGLYLFTSNMPGSYVVVQVDLPAHFSTADSHGANDNRIAVAVTSGMTSSGNVFLDARLVTVSGQVRHDIDADGDFNDPDTGMSGVTITLYTDPNGDGNPADGTIFSSRATDAGGHFVFTNVPPGYFVIVETDLAGTVSTADSQGTNDNRIAIALFSGLDSSGHVFLDSSLVSISGQVRHDLDADGDLLEVEAGITNVTIVLWTDPNGDGNPADGVAIRTNVTDSSGYYLFTGITAGRYVVVETDAPGFISTADSQGANDNRIAINVSATLNSTGNDFLDTRPVLIGGQVRLDTDVDGDLNDADGGLAGATVWLFTDPDRNGDPSDGIAVATNITTSTGYFRFTNFLAGGYVLVEEDPMGYASTADSSGLNDNRIPVILSSGDISTNHVFLDASSYDADLPGVVANIETIVAGSWVVPMDNSKQNIGVAFNLKSYGLLAALLHNNIPVKWVIRTGKAKDEVDFTIWSRRLYPSVTTASNIPYRSGPFIIPKIFTNQAAPIIAAYANSVAVYEVLSNVTVDVRYTINTRPVVAALNDGGTIAIHVNILTAAGFVEGVSYYQRYAYLSNAISTNSCYSFSSEPHFNNAAASNQANAIRGYVNAQGNFLAQCVGVLSYENEPSFGRFQTSNGIVNRDDVTTYTYPSADMPFVQFEGEISDEGGSLPSWGLTTTSSWINSSYMQVQGVQNTNTMKASHGKIVRGRSGGNVFYLGGHDYSSTSIGDLNGRRMYLNAVFVPSLRPDNCQLTFGADLAITKTDGSLYAPAGGTNVYTIVVTNRGPDSVLNARVVDVFPANFTNVAWSAVGTGGAVVPNPTGQGNINELIDLPNRGSVTFYATGLVLSSASCLLSNVAVVSVPENVVETDLSNNRAFDLSYTHVIDIGGNVRDDTNGLADISFAYPGISNVTVRLFTDPNGDGNPADGAIVGTRTTDPTGRFYFSNIITGRYVLEQSDLPGYLSVTDSDGTNDNRISFNVQCGITLNSTNNIFLDSRLGTVSGFVREDADADGDLADPDTGIPGVTVRLFTDPNGDGNPSDGLPIRTNITSATGAFAFAGIGTGRFVIVQTDLPGFISTTDNQGANDNQIAILMPGGQNSTGHIFLDTRPVEIGGQVREDIDGDADFSDPDPGISNVTIRLFTDPNGDGDPADGVAVRTNLTSITGAYLFTNVMPGRYVVVETDLAGYISTADSQGVNDNRIALTIVSSGNRYTNDFLDTRPANVFGQVRHDVDGDGELTDPDAGVSNVTIRLFTDPNRDGNPVDGVAIRTNVTISTGDYSFTNVIPGYYVIVITTPPGYQVSADKDGSVLGQIVLAHTSGVVSTSNDFLITQIALISGYVREDMNAQSNVNLSLPGISGVTVTLWSDPNGDGNPADGVVLFTNITDSAGYFVFSFLNPGNYVLVETDLAGYISTADSQGANDNRIAVNLPGGVNSTNNIFLDLRRADICGQVRDDLDGDGDLADPDPPLSGVTIRLFTDPNQDGNPSDGTAISTNVTDGSGNYCFTNVYPGYYVIVETDPSGYQSTADRDGGNLNWIRIAHRSGINTNGNDFLDSTRGAIRGQVRNDIDGNGDFSDPHIGIADVTLNLYTDPNGDGNYSNGVWVAATETDAQGNYAFTMLGTGRYVIVETDLPNFTSTADTDPPNDNRIRVFLSGGADTNGNVFLDNPVRVFKAVNAAVASADEVLTYSIFTFYAGNDPLTNVVLTDSIPVGTTYVTNSANASGTFSNNMLTWRLGSTASGTPGITYSNFAGMIGVSGDTYIDAGSPTVNYGSNTRLNVNPGTGKGNTVMNSLLVFDLSAIPAGATVNAAWLRTEVQSSGPNVNIYRATTTWTQNGATWNLRNGSAGWGGGGAFGASDYSNTVLGTIGAGSTGVYSNNVWSTVQSWYSGATSNQGFILASASNANGTAAFYSNEEGTASRRPALYVDWSKPQTSNTIDILPNMIYGTSAVQVVMRLSSVSALTNVTPAAALTPITSGGVTATLVSGPTPTNAIVHTNAVKFTYVYNVVAGSTTGSLAFTGGATASNGSFATATSDRIIVSPVFTFNARVNSSPGVTAVTNVAQLSETNFIPATNSNPVVTLLRGSVSGEVRNDLFANGNLSAAYPGISNVTVRLFTDPNGDGDPADGVAVATNVTDSTGSYRFISLATGRYVVVETDPAGALSTADSTPPNDNRIPVLLPGFIHVSSNIFLDTFPVPVSGQVRNDLDADGDLSAPDAGVSNVIIRLFTDPNADGHPSDGVAIATNVTDAGGYYLFPGVVPGRYVLIQEDPPGLHATGDRDGGVLNQIILSLTSRVHSVSNDFLISRLAAIFGYVRQDLNGNGDIHEADPGITNVMVVLYTDPNGDGDTADGTAVATNFTGATGNFVFGSLDTGHFVLVQTDLSGYVSTADSDPPNDNRIRVYLPGGLNSYSNIFLDAIIVAASGQVRDDIDGDGDFLDPDDGLADSVVQLFTDPNGDGNPADGVMISGQTTTVFGTFFFGDLLPGYYVLVEIDPPGYASTADTEGANDNRIPIQLLSEGISSNNVFLNARYSGITIAKEPSIPGDFSPGDVVTYTIRVSNTGVVPHPGVTIHDWYSPELTYLSDSTRLYAPAFHLRDTFSSSSYNQNDGSSAWQSGWLEIGENDGPAQGLVQVTDGRVRINGADRGITRFANLQSYGRAILSLDYRMETLDSDDEKISLYASSNGVSWVLLHEWAGPLGLSTGSVSYNISPYMASNTAIRFLSSASLDNADFGYFDNVRLEVFTAQTGAPPPVVLQNFTLGTGQSVVVTYDLQTELLGFVTNRACVTTAYESNPFCAEVVNEVIQLLMTQGMVVVHDTNEAWHLEWSATEDPVIRDYDIIYVDTITPGFNMGLTNQWDLAARIRDRAFEDLGSSNRPAAWGMGETLRFYRAAHKERWRATNRYRNASQQIYVAKAIQLKEGENWVSLFMIPDRCCASGVFGTDLLPAGPTMAESTVIEWYGATYNGKATNSIWLDSETRTWRYANGGNADLMPIPLHEGFNIVLPPGSGPRALPVIGLMPTNISRNTGTIQPIKGGIYNIVSYNLPYRVKIGQSGLREAGFRGPSPGQALNPLFSDEIRILTKGGGSMWAPVVRIIMNSSSNFVFWTGGPQGSSAEDYRFNVDDAIVLYTRKSNFDRDWVIPLPYPVPSTDMKP